MKTWAEIEKKVSAILLLAVAGTVMLDVLHRVLSRTPGKLALLLEAWLPTTITDQWIVPALLAFSAWALAKTAFVKLGKTHSGIRAFSVTTIVILLLWALLKFFPDGFIGAPYLALSLMLWAGLIAASSATESLSHLTVEVGEKIWPEKMKPWMNRIRYLTAGGVCFFLFILSVLSVIDHYQDYIETEGGGLIPALEWPKWILLSVVPYSFFMMAIRFFKAVQMKENQK